MELHLGFFRERVIGFIDMGTNSIRLLLVLDNPNHTYRIITQQKETVRLGEGEFKENYLQPEAIQRAVQVCRKFVELANNYHAQEIIAVATAATREAINKEEFLQKVKQEARVNIRVISGLEEARLIYLGVASGIRLDSQAAFFIDIGGGSTEVSIGNGNQHFYLDSLKLGAIRVSMQLNPDPKGIVSPEEYALLRKNIQHAAIQTINKLRKWRFDFAIGSSGTIENLAEITFRMVYKKALPKNHHLKYDHLKQLIPMLCAMSLAERRQVAGINPERADIIIGGAAILELFMEELGISELRISDRGLRDGLLIDYLSRNENNQSNAVSIRKKSIIRLGRACAFDEKHSENVSRLALELFDTANETGSLNLGVRERELLEYAALIHDIGTFLSYNNHQAHTYYLIKNADLLGFDQEEINFIATIAFYHRKAIPRKKHQQFAAFDNFAQNAVLLLSTLLKIAESLDRSHAGIVAGATLNCLDNKRAILEIKSKEDCQLEIWGVKKHLECFKLVFHRKLDILYHDAIV